MRPNCFRTSSTRPSNFVRPCIASACTALLFSLLCSVAGADVSLSDLQPLFDDVDGMASDTRSIQKNTRYLQGTLDTLNQKAATQSEYQRNLLLFLGGGVQPPTGYKPISTLLQEIASNTRNAGDALAGNPWWATNSAFTMHLLSYQNAFPDDGRDVNGMFSFPQFLSKWSSKLITPTYSPVRPWYQYWGMSSYLDWGTSNTQGYTWFDWMADASRSNWLLHASASFTKDAPSAEDTAATAAVDDGDTSGTNAVPEMVVERMNVTGVEDALDLIDADAVGDMFPSSFTDANPEFVVFSGGRYGAVTVPEVRGSLAVPENVARYLRGVAKWLWRVALFIGCFCIVRQEVAYWSTLGGSASDA